MSRRDSRILARSPYNIVHLTLPDSPAGAGVGDQKAWRAEGVLAEAPVSYWWVTQDYRGPDGVERTREGFAAAVEAVPYSARQVLPHDRPYLGAEGRPARSAASDGHPARADLPAVRRRAAARTAGRQARGGCGGGRRAHPSLVHRGRRALAQRAAPDRRRPPSLRDGRRLPRGAAGGDSHARDPGLVARAGAADLPDPSDRQARRQRARDEVEGAGRAESRSTVAASTSGCVPTTISGLVSSRRSSPRVSPIPPTPTGRSQPSIEETPRPRSCSRPVTVDQVAAFAERGETMPQKSTFFYPKLTSGLLLYPVG